MGNSHLSVSGAIPRNLLASASWVLIGVLRTQRSAAIRNVSEMSAAGHSRPTEIVAPSTGPSASPMPGASSATPESRRFGQSTGRYRRSTALPKHGRSRCGVTRSGSFSGARSSTIGRWSTRSRAPTARSRRRFLVPKAGPLSGPACPPARRLLGLSVEDATTA
jgi:hypothetical protein